MSGSSLDGLDIAACRFGEIDNHSLNFELLAAETMPIPENLILKIKDLVLGSAREFLQCDADLGHWMGKAVREFLEKYKILPDFIGSHGHTIFHEPGLGYSSQIGHSAHIAAQSGIPVVSDFRMADIAYGGQGAPMIPIAEKLLWPEYRQFVNLGGIVNISFHKEEEVIAYDVCAGNQLLNYLAKIKGLPYDKDGILSENGVLIPEVFNEYLSLDYVGQKAPKSLANDWIFDAVIPIFNPAKYKIEDLLVTAMEASAALLARAVKQESDLPQCPLMISGGGAHHPGWVSRINQQMRRHGLPEVYIPDPMIINFKEAIMMALAAWLRVQGKPNFIKSVTGANAYVSGGSVYLPAGYQMSLL